MTFAESFILQRRAQTDASLRGRQSTCQRTRARVLWLTVKPFNSPIGGTPDFMLFLVGT
jgi:hypothetical protein